MLELLFWMTAVVILYVYAGYPVLLWVFARVAAKPVARDEVCPSVTLIVSAFNEAEVIEQKLRNALDLDYPRASLEVLVVSDASDDGTDDLVRQFESQGVRLVRMAERGGKTLGLNEGVRQARGDVIVFSDANAMYRRDALRALVRNFADLSVGAVIGESTYRAGEANSERNEGLYWKYETWIKDLESRLGSTVGGDGAIYAVRRGLYEPMPADALSDFVNPMQVVRAGHRCIYEPAAQSVEDAAPDFSLEFRRKVRIVNRAWRATMRMKEMMNPLRHGRFSWELVSHKLLRWLVPLFMIGAFASNVLLAVDSTFYAATMLLQTTFYLLALAGYVLKDREAVPFVLSVPFYFCLVNLASLRGVVEAYRGKTYTTWTTARAS